MIRRIKKLLTLPPEEIAKRVLAKAKNKVASYIDKPRDLNNDTRSSVDLGINYSFVRITALDPSVNNEALGYLTEMYSNHRFDLLGSGWIENSYNSTSPGLEGIVYSPRLPFEKTDEQGAWIETLLRKNHFQSSQKIWQQITHPYMPIDWQKDFKSGFRWDLQARFTDQYTHSAGNPGTDIKVPWELARMHHLVQMAVFAAKHKEKSKSILLEFKNQTLDFIALNPPRMGCNWTCTMDVGIRAANLLVAYDIFKQLDESHILDAAFERVFSNSIYEHGKHIANNLEWSPHLTSNHYLANVAGLLFIAAYISESEETLGWLAFSLQELISEFKKQFYSDGANFEASTAYHRLSGEMICYGTAIALGLPADKLQKLKTYSPKWWKQQPVLKPLEAQEYKISSTLVLPDWYKERTWKTGAFTADITKPNGEIVQYGDNDSGRFLRFSPTGKFLGKDEACALYLNLSDTYHLQNNEAFWDENILQHQTFVAAVAGLFQENNRLENEFRLETSFVRSLCNNNQFQFQEKTEHSSTEKISYDLPDHYKKTLISLGEQAGSLKRVSYPDFGLHIFKSPSFFLSIFTGNNGQNGNGGHCHNHQLSVDINVKGIDLVRDPGTYLYTPLPHRRNQFRTTRAHNTIQVKALEQNKWMQGARGLFTLDNESRSQLLEMGENTVTCMTRYYEILHVRKIEITGDTVTVHDYCNKDFLVNWNLLSYYSNGYGKLLLNNKKRLKPI